MILVLLACASDPAPPGPPTPASTAPVSTPAPGATTSGAADGPTVPTMLGDAPGVSYLGEWTSKGCDGRSYARNIVFFEHGDYAAIDLVSPCPVDVACAWSGLVGFAGIWKQEGDKLLLREIGGGKAAGQPHPTEFVASPDGKLVENGCFYERGLTVPDGYEESRVRPKLPGSQ